MKILLDENIDVAFRKEFSGFDVETVKSKGWTGIANGKLLELAINDNFEVFITLDSNLQYQQNLLSYNIYIVNLKPKDSRLSTLKQLMPEIIKVLNRTQGKGSQKFVEILG